MFSFDTEVDHIYAIWYELQSCVVFDKVSMNELVYSKTNSYHSCNEIVNIIIQTDLEHEKIPMDIYLRHSLLHILIGTRQ